MIRWLIQVVFQGPSLSQRRAEVVADADAMAILPCLRSRRMNSKSSMIGSSGNPPERRKVSDRRKMA